MVALPAPPIKAVAHFLDGPRAGQEQPIPAIARGVRELPTVDEWLTVESQWGPVRYRRSFVTARADKTLVAMYLYQPKEVT